MNDHQIFLPVQNSYIVSAFDNSWISLAAPQKLVLWSLHMLEGIPRLAIKCLKVAINAAVVNSETVSRCTTFTEKHANTATYAFVPMGLHTGPCFISMGPA